MKTELSEQFKTTLNMPELSDLNVWYNSNFESPIAKVELLGYERGTVRKVLLKDCLPLINPLFDATRLTDAHVDLRSPRNFYLLLSYQEKNRYGSDTPEAFEAWLSKRHKMNYPRNIKNYAEWQIKLKELLAELKL